MPWRSPSPKHFKWWARTSFVEAISQSSFVGSGCSVQQSAFAESYPSWPSPLSQPRLTATVRVHLQVRVQDVLGPPKAGAHWRGWSAANPRPVERLVRHSYSAASSSYSSSTESGRYERWE